VQKIKLSTIESGQVIICGEREGWLELNVINLWNVCFSILSLG
jgi:hypothetical protein